MSLFHVTDMLSSEGMGVLEQSRARVTWVSPLSIAAAAISIFSAESERRGIAIQLHGQGKAACDIDVCCSSPSDGNNLGIEELNAVLQGQIDDIDNQAHSLISLRLLLGRLQGVGSVGRSDERLMMTLHLPMSLTTSNQEKSPSIQELPAA